MKILAYNVQPYEDNAFKTWAKENDIEVVIDRDLLTKDTAKRAEGFDGVTTQQVIPVKEEEIFKTLKDVGIEMIASRTAGVDMFDGNLAKEYGISITNVPAYSPNAIAELSVSHALHLLRNVKRIEKAMKVGDYSWNHELLGREIRNCTVGIVGTGKIGRTAASIYKGFGANVIGYDKFPCDDAKQHLEYKDSLDELLQEADIVSLHLPLLDDTYHLINKENLCKMKEGAILVNTGRGALVDIEDVVDALESGELFGAGIDVLEMETEYVNQKIAPEKVEKTAVERLRNMDNVVFTPHYAFFTDEAVKNIVETSLENIRTYKDSGKLVNSTNM